jgi:hypothetical protein
VNLITQTSAWAMQGEAVRFAIPGRARAHLDPFHECADSTRQVAPMRYYQADVERLVLKIW